MEAYQNKYIKKEIKEKWFCVYDYISFKELFLTVQKDYLAILNFINIPFWLITIVLFVINPFYAIGLMLLVYFVINIILFIKLIYRSYYFLLVSDVVFTNKWIILWNKAYSSEKEAEKSIKKYEKMFLETLGQESKLQDAIDKKIKKLKDNTINWWWKILKGLFEMSTPRRTWFWTRGRSNDNWGFIILITLWMAAYSIFLYSFYYIGYFLWILFFYIFSYFLKLIIRFKRNIELDIKNDTLKLDNSLKKLDLLQSWISNKLSEFKWGKISNLAPFIGKAFGRFYNTINISLKQKDDLIKLLQSYKYSDFIDFDTLQKYIRNNFNKPVKDMISLLDKTWKDIEKQIIKLDETIKNSNHESVWTLEQKKLQLSHSLDIVIANKAKFEKSIL